MEHEGGVGDGAGHGADVVAVEAGDHEAALAHAAVGLLEADDAAEGAGEADGAAEVGAQGGKGDFGGDVGTATATGTAGYVVEIPGVVDSAVVGVVGGGTGGELLEVFLAEDDGTGLLAEGDDVGVFFGGVVRQDLGADGGADSADLDVVLDAHGDAAQETGSFATGEGRFLFAGLGQSLVAHEGNP